MASAPRAGEPLTPIGNGSFGAVSSCHFGGVGLNLMVAIPGTRRSRVAPRRGGTTRSGEHVQPQHSRGSSAGRVETSPSAAISSRSRRVVLLQWGQRFAWRFGSDHVAISRNYAARGLRTGSFTYPRRSRPRLSTGGALTSYRHLKHFQLQAFIVSDYPLRAFWLYQIGCICIWIIVSFFLGGSYHPALHQSFQTYVER